MNLSANQPDIVIFLEILAYLPLRPRIPHCEGAYFFEQQKKAVEHCPKHPSEISRKTRALQLSGILFKAISSAQEGYYYRPGVKGLPGPLGAEPYL